MSIPLKKTKHFYCPLHRRRPIDGTIAEPKKVLAEGTFGTVYVGYYGMQSSAIKEVRTDEEVPNSLCSFEGAQSYYGSIDARTEKEYRIRAWDCCEEAELFLRFREHPNVVTCYDYKLEPTWIIMELCDANLKQYFTRKNWSLKPGEEFDALNQLNEGLLALHSQRVVHRNIKLENILVKYDDDQIYGQCFKISDFGFAATEANLLSRDRQGKSLTSHMRQKPPELTQRGKNTPRIRFTDKIDMWALGTIFFALHSRGIRFNAENESLISFLQDLKAEVEAIPVDDEVSKSEMNKVYRVLDEGILKEDPEIRLSSKKVAEIMKS